MWYVVMHACSSHCQHSAAHRPVIAPASGPICMAAKAYVISDQVDSVQLRLCDLARRLVGVRDCSVCECQDSVSSVQHWPDGSVGRMDQRAEERTAVT